MNFKSSVFVIADGGEGDIGRKCAELLPKRGAKVIHSPKNALESIDKAIDLHGRVDGLLIAFPTYGGSSGCHTFDENEWAWLRTRRLDDTYRDMKKMWPIMRKQRHGRVVFVMEANSDSIADCAGLFALLGLAHTLALEGDKYHIGVSVIVNQSPFYVTGVSHTTTLKDVANHISAFAVSLLRTPDLTHSGALFQISQRGTSKWKWQRSQGVLLNPDENFTAAALSRKWEAVGDFASASFPDGPADFASILPRAQALPKEPTVPEIRFDGKVVIVTGAASGLGHCYSKAFAALGAAVIVSDIADPAPVVKEIRVAGGKATGCQAGCESAQTIIDAAMEAYGRVDILINNAGFLRDKAFVNMDEQTWKSVLDVHLNGMYQMTKAVWPQFVRQGGGSVVNTASTSGVYGVFGQANYSAAKLGVLGLSEATARQGAKHNIRVNTICPVASTGALAAAWANTLERGKDVDMKAEYNVPAVLLLSAETLKNRKNDISGGLFEIGCGLHMVTCLHPVAGIVHKDLTAVTPEAMVIDWKDDVLTKVEFCKDISIACVEYDYCDRNVILYNLSAGANRSDLSLVYEGSPDFQALPTFGIVPFFSRAVITHHAKLLPNFNLDKGLLGEHYLEILRHPIPTSGYLRSSGRPLDVADKKSAAIVRTGYSTVDAKSDEPLFYNETTFFAGGAGGFGGQGKINASQAPASRITLPSRPADKIISHRTSPEQAALYRLNGDREELHIDPAAAKRHGFAHPILHGMCSMSIAGLHIWKTYGALRSIRARFTSVVVPEDTLVIEMWKEGVHVLYKVSEKESGKVCIDKGVVRLWSEDDKASRL